LLDELEFKRQLNESARLLGQNRPGEAVEKLLPLSEQSPDHPDVLINLSGAYILQRKWNMAVRVLKIGLKSHPTNAMLWANLGAAELGRLETSGPRQQDKAIAAYQHALQVDPEAPNVHYHLGLIYKARKELMRSAAFFQRALEVNPADQDARYWLDRLTREIQESVQERIQAVDEDEVEIDLEVYGELDIENGGEVGDEDEDEPASDRSSDARPSGDDGVNA
jgi:tetratricopeptide (TPR) repeat protein